MSERCDQCGDEVVWDGEANSSVCVGCGILQDPTQTVLDSHIELPDNAREHHVVDFRLRTTPKGVHRTSGWSLSGQSRRAAAERNKLTMVRYTEALARRLGHPGLAGRAVNLFESAMEKGCFRYGRRARLVAGASLAIALRENKKGGTMRDIAYLLDETPIALARIFTTVVGLMEVRLTAVDPSWHLPAVQKQVVDAQAEHGQDLMPRSLMQVLKSIRLPSVLRVAMSLSELVSRTGMLTDVPSTAIACGIYIIALEGELQRSLPLRGELARALGRRFGDSKDVVMRRYKIIYDQIKKWAEQVPWLGSKCERQGGDRAHMKRAKRDGVALHVKEVVEYQEILWKTRLEAQGPVLFELGKTEENGESENTPQPRAKEDVPSERAGRKRGRKAGLDDVSRFLLSPLGAKTTGLEAASHVLSWDGKPMNGQMPTRLQQLATERNADEIGDEELFADGELEGYMRPPEEQEVLAIACDWARSHAIEKEVREEEANSDASSVLFAARPEEFSFGDLS